VKIAGVKHWLWHAVDQDGFVLDILVQSRREKDAAKRLWCTNYGPWLRRDQAWGYRGGSPAPNWMTDDL
jgi:hypothetical protein